VVSLSVYQQHIEQLFAVLKRAAEGLARAGIDYRLVGGLAVFFHVDARDPIAARFTRDIDLAVYRRDLEAIRGVLEPLGFTLNPTDSKARNVIHLVFLTEVPDSPPITDLAEGIALAPVADLVEMKLTSFREKDRVHVRDMDAVGLITHDIEDRLNPELRNRLQQVRSTE
jgi:hypothetical protein